MDLQNAASLTGSRIRCKIGIRCPFMIGRRKNIGAGEKELLNNESEDRAKNKTGLVLEGGGMRGSIPRVCSMSVWMRGLNLTA